MVLLLTRLFKAHPSTIQLFPKFVSVPLAELPQNRDFQAYGNMVMSGLNFMVENIENPSLMKQLMCAQGIDKYFVQGVSITQQLQVYNNFLARFSSQFSISILKFKMLYFVFQGNCSHRY